VNYHENKIPADETKFTIDAIYNISIGFIQDTPDMATVKKVSI